MTTKSLQSQDAAVAGPGASGAGGGGGGGDDMDTLREDVEAALGEAALAQERQQLMQLEVGGAGWGGAGGGCPRSANIGLALPESAVFGGGGAKVGFAGVDGAGAGVGRERQQLLQLVVPGWGGGVGDIATAGRTVGCRWLWARGPGGGGWGRVLGGHGRRVVQVSSGWVVKGVGARGLGEEGGGGGRVPQRVPTRVSTTCRLMQMVVTISCICM